LLKLSTISRSAHSVASHVHYLIFCYYHIMSKIASIGKPHHIRSASFLLHQVHNVALCMSSYCAIVLHHTMTITTQTYHHKSSFCRNGERDESNSRQVVLMESNTSMITSIDISLVVTFVDHQHLTRVVVDVVVVAAAVVY
jgi:hypothetical protein